MPGQRARKPRRAFSVAQPCYVADLYKPVFLTADRKMTGTYAEGQITLPEQLWESSA
jgi:hypothetical protein